MLSLRGCCLGTVLLTGGEGLGLSGRHLVDAALLVDEAALDHLEVQVACHLGNEQHAHQLACPGRNHGVLLHVTTTWGKHTDAHTHTLTFLDCSCS